MTINEIFNKYLAEQKKELAPRTFNYYKNAIDLMSVSFNSYGHLYLGEEQSKYFDKKCEQGVEFCDFFGAEVLDDFLFFEFLGYFLPRKTVMGYDSARKICGASLNLYKWLVQNRYLEDDNIQMTINELREEFKDSWEKCNKPFKKSDFF